MLKIFRFHRCRMGIFSCPFFKNKIPGIEMFVFWVVIEGFCFIFHCLSLPIPTHSAESTTAHFCIHEFTDAHDWLVPLWLMGRFYATPPSLKAQLVLLSWIPANWTNVCGNIRIWTCYIQIIGQMLFCCSTQEPHCSSELSVLIVAPGPLCKRPVQVQAIDEWFLPVSQSVAWVSQSFHLICVIKPSDLLHSIAWSADCRICVLLSHCGWALT